MKGIEPQRHRDTERDEATLQFHASSNAVEGRYGDEGNRETRPVAAKGRDSFHPPISLIPIFLLSRLTQRQGANEKSRCSRFRDTSVSLCLCGSLFDAGDATQ